MNKSLLFLLFVCSFIFCCLPGGVKALSGDIGAHDPSTIIREGNKYWVFTTGDGINAIYSTDLYNWKSSGKTIFPKNNWPAWINNYVPSFGGSFWAPDVIFCNGKYYMYYACSALGSPMSAIGVATSPTLDPNSPAYKWEDGGMVVSSLSLDDINAIDPSVFLDSNGKMYLSYGSYSGGIGVVELDTLTGKVKPGAKLNRVAGGDNTAWEASCLIREGNYYYLFANRAFCCRGTYSTYYIVAGRSTSPTGPFVDKNGINLKDNSSLAGGTPVMVSAGKYVGPGHFALLRDNGRNVVSMHYYDGNDNGNPKLDLAALQFSADRWPIINRNYLPAGRYKITNSQSNLLWEAPGCSGAEAVQITTSTDMNTPCQGWDLTPVGDGLYKISNEVKSVSVDVPSCNAFNGANLQGWTWLNNDCQKFKIDQLANGQYVFTSSANRATSKVIQVSAGSAGSPLNLFDYNGSPSQQWTVSQLTPPIVYKANDITDSTFTARWNTTSDTSFRLDVFTSPTSAAFQTVASWNFESGTNKANAGLPENIGKPIEVVGTDAAISIANGNGGKTAQATGWTFGYLEKYWEARVTTSGYFNIKVSSKQRSASNGPRHFKLQYKIGMAGTYTDIPIGFVSNLENYTAGVLTNINLPQECENQPLVFLRWLLITPTNLMDGGIENSGKSNIDDIVVTGNQGNFLPGYQNRLVNDTAERLRGLPPGTDFFFRVRSVAGGFASINSDVMKVTTTGAAAVNFDSIKAFEIDRHIQVDWNMFSENNIIRYEVEKSVNGRIFTQIGGVTAKSKLPISLRYSYVDLQPTLGDNYYRIKAIMSTGVIKYSSTVKVYLQKGNARVFFYPNPSDGKTIVLHLFNQAAGVNEIVLVNSMGQQVYKTAINHGGGSLNLTLLLGNLSSGIYFCRVTNGSVESTQKIMVDNR